MVGPEVGLTQPGKVIVCGIRIPPRMVHLVQLPLGIGTFEVEHVLATQTIWQKQPKTLGIKVTGQLPKGVYAKDIILALIRNTGLILGLVMQRNFMERRLKACPWRSA